MTDTNFIEFLKDTPLYVPTRISGFLDKTVIDKQRKQQAVTKIQSCQARIDSDIKPRLFCDSEGCNTETFFEHMVLSELDIPLQKKATNKLSLRCCNCKKTLYKFFIEIESDITQNADNSTVFNIQKVGQVPRYGVRAPKKALNLLGKERELFFKGLNCEREGMGIGAFSYFRRVIDSQKSKIFDEIIKVLDLSEGNEELIEQLKEAKVETQFTSSVNKIKAGLPESLQIAGHNPLTLLYSALSEGLHSQTDSECLEMAHDIKIVLYAFAEKLEIALKSHQELAQAVSRLAKRK